MRHLSSGPQCRLQAGKSTAHKPNPSADNTGIKNAIRVNSTHTEAAEGDHEEELKTTGHTRDPGHSNEEQHSQDVLDGGQEHAQEGAQFVSLKDESK